MVPARWPRATGRVAARGQHYRDQRGTLVGVAGDELLRQQLAALHAAGARSSQRRAVRRVKKRGCEEGPLWLTLKRQNTKGLGRRREGVTEMLGLSQGLTEE